MRGIVMRLAIMYAMLSFVLLFCSISYGKDEECVIFQIVPDFDGTMWFATTKGVIHVLADGKMEKYDKSKGLNNDLVMQVVIGPDGSKWFIHTGVLGSGAFSAYFSYHGVSHLKKDGSIEIFGHDGDQKKLSKEWVVHCVAFDIDKSTWIGTNMGAVHFKNNGQIDVWKGGI